MVRARELLKRLQSVHPDTFIVTGSPDHSYRHIYYAEPRQAVVERGTENRPQEFSEYYGDPVEGSVLDVFCIN